MSITLSALQQQRRDTAANWTSANPTLLAGEIGVETDTGLLKIGDGSTAWTSLDYLPLSFEGYAANGIYNPAANQVALATNSTGRLFIDSSGNTGVGTSSPGAKFEVSAGNIRVDNNQALEFGGGNNYIYGNETTDFVGIATNGSERLRIDSVGRVLVGASTARTNFYNTTTNYGKFQVEGVGNSPSSIAIISNYDSQTLGSRLILSKNNSQTIGTNVLVDNGNTLGGVTFQGNDGTNFVEAALIVAQVDGTAAADDMPGRLVFYTNSGSSTVTERMRIDSSGIVKIEQSSTDKKFRVISTGSGGASMLFQNSTTGTGISDGLYLGLDSGEVGYLWHFETKPLVFATDNDEKMRIDSSGRLLIGASSGRTFGSFATNGGNLQVEGTAYQTSSMSLTNNQAAGDGSYLLFGKSRGTTVGSNTIVADDDLLGALWFSGADGTQLARGVEISAAVDGTPGANDMPGRLVFKTSADGSITPTERMRIDSSGDIEIMQGKNLTWVYEGGSTHRARIRAESDDALIFENGYNNQERMRIDSSGSVGIGGAPTSTGSTTTFEIINSTTARALFTSTGSGGRKYGWYTSVNGQFAVWDYTAGSERMRIDSSGNVAIGNTSPSGTLDVQDNTGSLSATKDITGRFYREDGTYNPRLEIRHSTAGTDLHHTYSTTAGNLTFSVGSNERMRIDSNGTLTTGDGTATGGITLLQGYYSSPHVLNVLGAHHSSGGTVLAYACRPKSGASGYVSSAGNFAAAKVAIELAESGRAVTFKYAAGATVAIGDDVTLARIAAFTPDGLAFGSDTAAANSLDDYEEGTWTPTLGGTATYSTQQGSYVKIGKFVHVTFYITISAIGTGSTYILSGLPFTAATYTGGGPLAYWAGLASNYTYISAYIYGTTNLTLYGSTAATTTLSTANFLTTGSAIQGSLVYRAA